MINNTVSRTCVLVRSLDGGQQITDLSTVRVVVRPRRQIPFGTCEPCSQSATSYQCGPVLGSTPAVADPVWLRYPAHDFSEDRTRICFHWDPLLWAQPPGRYMATVYLCDVAIGCFQMQVGKRFVADDPINVAFNPGESTSAVCAPTVDLCVATPTVDPTKAIAWASPISSVAGTLSAGNNGTSTTIDEFSVLYGGTIPGITSLNVAYLVTAWEPQAWTSPLSGSLTAAQQVIPTTAIGGSGIITAVPHRPAGGGLGDISHGTLRISALVDGVLFRNALILTISGAAPTTTTWSLNAA